mmetsp:Transcript_43410/g.88816  ORF Transcript_43410/g.88816 Transcript_43410/m.88816 type:complete len:240 (-) Transcript_43410:1817-2536(-)
MDAKLSSMTMMSAAFWATWVPVLPIANPTSALLSAGASLVPSPVTATVCGVVILLSWIPVTSVSLSSGDERASTRKFTQTLSNSTMSISSFSPSTLSRNSGPVRMVPPSSRMPHLRAMAAAVRGLSPVTIRTTMPALLHTRIASGTSSRTGSSRPQSASSVSPSSSPSSFATSGLVSNSRKATDRVRRPSSANSPMAVSSFSFTAAVSSSSPCSVRTRVQSPSTISDAPLVYRMYLPFF